MTSRSIWRGARVLVVGGAIALALGSAATALAADHAVGIANSSFSPRTITVAVGDTVTWNNADERDHTATADDGAFDSGTIASGTSGSVTLTTAGTFPYHCRIHSAMTATLIVEAAAGTAPPTDTTLAASLAGESIGAEVGTAIFVALAGLVGLAIGAGRFRRRAADR